MGILSCACQYCPLLGKPGQGVAREGFCYLKQKTEAMSIEFIVGNILERAGPRVTQMLEPTGATAAAVTVPSLCPRVHHLHPLAARGDVLLPEGPPRVPPCGCALPRPRGLAPLEGPSPARRPPVSCSQQAAVPAGKRPRVKRGKPL